MTEKNSRVNPTGLEILTAETCYYCDSEGTVTQPSGVLVCEECHNNCEHDEIEGGDCQDCGAHMSDFLDEDYGRGL